MARDVIVVGGGIIGCSIALRLAQSGVKVAVFERGRIGCEASWAAAGMLSAQTSASGPGPFFDLCIRSREMYPDLSSELLELSGIDVEYSDEGALCVALEEGDEGEVEEWSGWQREAGLGVERLTASEARSVEPELVESAAGAVFIPGDHQVENRLVMEALAVALKKVGAEVLEERAVDALAVDRGKVIGVISRGEKFAAGVVVVAAGCWSEGLLAPLGLKARVVPVRGQMVALKGEGPPITRILHSRECYLIPRRDGRILVGATVEHVGFKKAVTAGGLASLTTSAVQLVPALGHYEVVESWSGLRPDTVDHLPILGECGIDGLFLATGHFRNGILLAPITAQLITTLILSHSIPPSLIPFGIQRFDTETNVAV